MEQIPCPISNSTSFTPFLQVPDRFDPTGIAKFSLVRSTFSGLIMLNPRPESAEMADHYLCQSYEPYLNRHSVSTIGERVYLAARSLLVGYRASLILKGWRKPLNDLSVLEIGCSTGELLNYLHQKKGTEQKNLAGVEPDCKSLDYGRAHYGLKIYPSFAETAQGIGDQKKFDRIVLWHSLEHIHDLHETLSLANTLLDQEGVIVLALPNMESHDACHYRENWIAWDAPRHLYHFVPDTLEKVLALHQLQLAGLQPYLPDSLYNTLNSEKLRSEREGGKFGALQFGDALRQAIVAVITGVLWPLKASSIVYFVRKKFANKDLKDFRDCKDE
ncbi:MAG: class I SAM-dependent methyltransferase [Chlorobiaceae bacterium]|nr:class I SAM-dependent methyltransferase [Chlorobiaceae bacterium]